MNRLLLIIFSLFIFSDVNAQPNQLFIKKGVHKKRSYYEGDRIHVQLVNGTERTGIITRLVDSSVFINGKEIRQHDISAVIIDGVRKNKLPDLKTMALIGAGVGLTTLGLTLNDANEPKTAIIAGLTIGYAPILLKFLGGRFLYALTRKKYKMGKKFSIRVFDITPKRSF